MSFPQQKQTDGSCQPPMHVGIPDASVDRGASGDGRGATPGVDDVEALIRSALGQVVEIQQQSQDCLQRSTNNPSASLDQRSLQTIISRLSDVQHTLGQALTSSKFKAYRVLTSTDREDSTPRPLVAVAVAAPLVTAQEDHVANGAVDSNAVARDTGNVGPAQLQHDNGSAISAPTDAASKNNNGETRRPAKRKRGPTTTSTSAASNSRIKRPDKERRRRDIAIPDYAPPQNGTQYTKQEALQVLAPLNKRDRNQIVRTMIAREQIPLSTPMTMNKYIKEYLEHGQCSKADWETTLTLEDTYIPPPADGKGYGRREAVTILQPLEAKQRMALVGQWMTAGKIAVTHVSAVSRALKQAQKDGVDSLSEHWGRWATDPIDDMKKKPLPPYPPPKFGSEYTKVEAISILQKMTPSDRTVVVWKWIQSGQVPVNHPNSMLRLMREAEKGKLTSMDWRMAHSSPCWVPPPQNGSCYTKEEMIQVASKYNPRDRNKLLRQWVQEKKVPFTCPLSANGTVMKAMREQQEIASASNNTKGQVAVGSTY